MCVWHAHARWCFLFLLAFVDLKRTYKLGFGEMSWNNRAEHVHFSLNWRLRRKTTDNFISAECSVKSELKTPSRRQAFSSS
jgi:hypothetical protein